MTSRKDFMQKYYFSDIFNLIDESSMGKTKPKLRLNHSSLEITKEDVFNIGKEKRISRNENKEIYSNHSVEKRKNNYEKIYGSDIFNLRAKSVERRNGRHHMPQISNRSTCFDEMKNNEEYIKNFKEYIKEKRGEVDINKNNIKTVDNNDENEIRYIKNKRGNIEKEKTAEIISRNENNNISNFRRKRTASMYSSEKRKFVDLDEYRENNCKINKQLQFESHLFSNNDNNFFKTKEDIKEINDRINQEKYPQKNINILGQPIIRVNRKKRDNNKNLHSSMDKINTKMKPANMNWDSLQSQVMFSPDYTKNLYKNYGPKGPTAYQRRLHQFADSDNIDTLSGLQKNDVPNFKYLKKPIPEEIKNKEEKNKIDKILNNIPNLSEGQKLEIKMKSSILDFRDEKERYNKEKELNDFLKKEKKKKIVIPEKINHMNRNKDSNKRNKDILAYNNYTITYGIKNGNNFDNFNDNEIKNIFGKKGLNVYDIHKNTFVNGNKYNIIDLKISENNKNDEINKKIKLIEEELIKKNYKLKIEKGNKSNKLKNTINNPGGKIAIMKENTANKKEEAKFKIMPNEYKAKRGFTKQFSGINYSYKNPNQLF